MAKQPRHSSKDVQFGTFDINFDKVRHTVDQIVQRRDGNRFDSSDRRIHAFSKQTVDGACLASEEQVAHLVGPSKCHVIYGDVGEGVDGNVLAQDANIVAGGLDGHD